jgi:hypothetical protein
MGRSTFAAVALAVCLQVGCTPAWQPTIGFLPGTQVRGNEYLELAAALASSGEAAEREAVARAVRQAYDDAPTAPNRLRMAIVQATPHHAEADLDTAHANLELLVSLDDVLSPAEHDIAQVYLAQVRRQLELRNEIGGLRSQVGSLVGDVRRFESRLGELRGEVERLQAQIELLTAVELAIGEREWVEPLEPPGAAREDGGSEVGGAPARSQGSEGDGVLRPGSRSDRAGSTMGDRNTTDGETNPADRREQL